MKLFLCHSTHDKPLVREVARFLPRELQTWIDEREIHIAQDLHEAIADGIAHSAFLVAFLTDASLQSSWVANELELAFAREHKREVVYILPVVIHPLTRDMPALLAERRYASLRSRDERDVAQLARDIAEAALHWTCESDPFLHAFRDLTPLMIAAAGRSSQEAAIIATHAIPMLSSSFTAEFRRTVLGEAGIHTSPDWLASSMRFVAQYIQLKPDAALVGTWLRTPLEQAFLVGYTCAKLRRPIFSIQANQGEIDVVRLVALAEEVARSASQDRIVALGAGEAMSATMSILLVVSEGLEDHVHPFLKAAAWWGINYAIAEERYG